MKVTWYWHYKYCSTATTSGPHCRYSRTTLQLPLHRTAALHCSYDCITLQCMRQLLLATAPLRLLYCIDCCFLCIARPPCSPMRLPLARCR